MRYYYEKETLKEKEIKYSHLKEKIMASKDNKQLYLIWYKNKKSGYIGRFLLPIKIYQEYTEKKWVPSDLVVYYPEFEVKEFGQLLSFTVYKYLNEYLIIDIYHSKYMVGTIKQLFKETVDESMEDLNYWLEPKNRTGFVPPKYEI